jgi:hypothetical protein
VRAEAAEGVGRETVPFDRRIEQVRAVEVAVADGRLATKRVVRRALEPGAPLGARVEADLAEGVDRRIAGALHEDDRVVAVEVQAAVRLIRDRDDARGGAGMGDHERRVVRDDARERDRRSGGHGAVEVHLDLVRTRRQVDGAAGVVPDLDHLVVRRAFDVLRNDEVGIRKRGRRGGDRDHGTECGHSEVRALHVGDILPGTGEMRE